MFEAVNSVVSNAPLLRSSVDQVDTARQAPVQAQIAEKPDAAYISPYINVDLNFDRAVILIRDSSTGDVLNQYPSRVALEARAAQLRLQESLLQESGAAQFITTKSTEYQVPVVTDQVRSAIDALFVASQSGQTQTTFSASA